MMKLMAILALVALISGTPLSMTAAYAQEECPEGEVYNPDTAQCEKSEESDEPQCEEGQVYNPDTAECEIPQQ